MGEFRVARSEFRVRQPKPDPQRMIGDTGPADFTRAAALDDVPPSRLLAVQVDGINVCLANADGQIYAFKDNCSHRDFPLSEGALEGTKIECAWHGARFDITTGRALSLPAIKPIHTYDVKVEDGEIYVAVEEKK